MDQLIKAVKSIKEELSEIGACFFLLIVILSIVFWFTLISIGGNLSTIEYRLEKIHEVHKIRK